MTYGGMEKQTAWDGFGEKRMEGLSASCSKLNEEQSWLMDNFYGDVGARNSEGELRNARVSINTGWLGWIKDEIDISMFPEFRKHGSWVMDGDYEVCSCFSFLFPQTASATKTAPTRNTCVEAANDKSDADATSPTKIATKRSASLAALCLFSFVVSIKSSP